ncbi:organic cation transporter protein-like [Condylostylus longicornis]|uniref:organic cation transporter protein-like n=1 Tax=Condylostylus longicornis TaxID=2530218 RepID=UPI00244E32E0|nr:organic cation transporter protein-like [Condylostylus longicornis]
MGHIDEIKNLTENFLEKKGRFQIFLIIVLALNSMSVGINHTITSFYTYKPNFYCADDDESLNSTCTIGNTTNECQTYSFDPTDDETIVSEFSLVCKNEYIGPLTNTLYFVGVTIGSLLCNMLCDKFGRKKVVLTCMYSIILLSICVYFGNSLTLFIIFRIVLGIFVQGLQTCTYILIMEYSPSRNRTAAAIFWELNWTFGLMILGGVAYKIHSWRVLTLVMTIPLVLSVIYSWLIPESISWLYVNNKYHECVKAIKSMAKKNQDTATMDACNTVLKNLENDITLTSSMENYNTEDGPKSSTGIMDVLRSFILRKHLIIMIAVWFSVTLSYYGILYYLPNLTGQRHINFLVGAVAENLGYVSSYFVLSRFGRRIPMTFYQIANGVILIFVGFSYFIEESEVKGYSVLVLTMLAKGLTVSSFGGMFMYASELFPTICRGFALGLCCFAARVASLLAPQFMFLATIIPAYIPMTIIGLLVSATGLATILLPETLNSTLPNTIEEAHDVWEKPNKL